MKDILVARIDDRLIHGQVVTAWVKAFPITTIVIVDDELASNDLMQRIYTAAAPVGITVTIMSEADAAPHLAGEGDGQRYLVLAKGPEVFERLLGNGVSLQKVILGGMGAGQGRKTLIRNISAGQAERDSLRRIIERGVPVVYQMVPADGETDIASALRKGA